MPMLREFPDLPADFVKSLEFETPRFLELEIWVELIGVFRYLLEAVGDLERFFIINK